MTGLAALLCSSGGPLWAQEIPQVLPTLQMPAPPAGCPQGKCQPQQPKDGDGQKKDGAKCGDDGQKKDGDGEKKDEPKSPWLKVPSIQVLPPPGYFNVTPTGPGYYSLWDVVTDNYREKPPKFGYPRFSLMFNPFFDADWRYLDDPKNKDTDFFDALHRLHIGDDWLFNTGGEFRNRTMNEVNSRLKGVSNDYDLVRTREYADLCYRDLLRVYVEFIYADSLNQNLAPLPIDVNRGDLLNAFIDLKLAEIAGQPVYLRTGRQELLYGSQRLVSPLDWANTLRTFQGFRLFRRSEKFDIDLFYVQPVIPNATHFDSVDNHQNFVGLWGSFRPKKKHFIDLYYLFLDNTQPAVVLGETSSIPYNVSTFGTRYAGTAEKGWLWDVELDLQLGSRGSQDIIAGAAAVNFGYNFKQLPWNPTLWGGWEFASGSQEAYGHTYSTFNQLYPFGHYYFGFLDLVGRQNIHDLMGVLYLYPTPWITLINQYHHFELASATDALYNAAGTAIRRDVSGKAGTNVGDEIDIAVNFHLDKHQDVLVGYSQLFSGSFITRTGPGLSPELIYVQYSFRW